MDDSRHSSFPTEAYVAVSQEEQQKQFLTCHNKLGHPNNKILKQILQSCNTNLDYVSFFCEACQLGKSKKLPISKSISHANSPRDLVHIDLWGPSPIQSTNGFRFYIIFIDDFSRYSWIYPLKHKSEAVNAFNIFRFFVENKFSTKIKAMQCDNGGEYRPIVSIAQATDIKIKLICPYTSTQNGRAERKHRHVVEMGLTRLAQASLPLCYWVEAF